MEDVKLYIQIANQMSIHSLGTPPENSRQLLFETIWGFKSYNAWHWKFPQQMYSEAASKTTDSHSNINLWGGKKLNSLQSKWILLLVCGVL